MLWWSDGLMLCMQNKMVWVSKLSKYIKVLICAMVRSAVSGVKCTLYYNYISII